MIDIYNVSLLDILPPNLKEDPDIIAASKSVDKEFTLIANEVKQCILLPRIDELDNDVLDILAWQMHVDFYSNDFPINVKRELIKNSNKLHKFKGTPAAVEMAAKIVFGRSWIEEWFDYGGDPYMFKVDVEITNRGASEDDIHLLEKLINIYKNKRSWVELIRIFLATNGNIFFAGCTFSGESITVYPWTPKELESKGFINVSTVIARNTETSTIYPKKEV